MTAADPTRFEFGIDRWAWFGHGDDRSSPVTGKAAPTARESQLILLISQGLPNKIIAYELGISPNTVRTHVSNIMRKYKLRNRTQIAIFLRQRVSLTAEPAIGPHGEACA